MPYRCRVERDSISTAGHRLTTMVIEYARTVLAEVATHRVLSDSWGELTCYERTATKDISKNSSSSRAIPIHRMIDNVMRDPYIPERFSRNGAGMQGHGWLEGAEHERAVEAWLNARDLMVAKAKLLLEIGVHKQEANRLLEPWMFVQQVVTATQWDNFFALRCDAMAAPAFQKIARMMYLAYRASKPVKLDYGQWHLPFVPPEEAAKFIWKPDEEPSQVYDAEKRIVMDLPDLIKFSAARCAWVSYANADKEGSPEKMLATYDKLIKSRPVHASPLEHQATPQDLMFAPKTALWSSNLQGWVQARKLVAGEKVTKYEPTDEEVASWGITEPLWRD